MEEPAVCIVKTKVTSCTLMVVPKFWCLFAGLNRDTCGSFHTFIAERQVPACVASALAIESGNNWCCII
jgi:hypothetical protein